MASLIPLSLFVSEVMCYLTRSARLAGDHGKVSIPVTVIEGHTLKPMQDSYHQLFED